MPEGTKPVAKEAFELIGIASGRCDLPNRKRSQRGGVSDLARDIQAVHEILQILGIAEVIRINSDGIICIRPSEMDGATAPGTHSDNQGAGVSRQLERRGILRRDVWPATRVGVEIGRVERCIRLPETCSLTSRHAGKPDVCTFPDASERDVVIVRARWFVRTRAAKLASLVARVSISP